MTPILTILLPTVNERENIKRLIPQLLKLPIELEIIIIDDNSVDGTRELVRSIMKRYNNIKLIERPKKMGLGSAYKDGFKLSQGEIIITMDADLSHDPKYILSFIEVMKQEKADIVIGSRYVSGGEIKGWKFHRKIISKVANIIARTILRLPVKDATSGYRMYRRQAFEKTILLSKASGYEFQIEILFLAKKQGFKIIEYPIVFIDRIKGKSKLKIKDVFEFLIAVFKLRTSKY